MPKKFGSSRRLDREVTMSQVGDNIVGGNWRNATWHEVLNLAGLATPLAAPRVRVDPVLAASASFMERSEISCGSTPDTFTEPANVEPHRAGLK